jgi:hypothetical protein
MSDSTKQIILSYLRHFGGLIVFAYVAVAGMAAPWDLAGKDWRAIATAGWVALLPVIAKFLPWKPTK